MSCYEGSPQDDMGDCSADFLFVALHPKEAAGGRFCRYVWEDWKGGML